MTRHDNWANYEQAVEDATSALHALSCQLEKGQDAMRADWVVPAVAAEYALSDPICALQEAETWSRARSALLFWTQRWPRAVGFVAMARPTGVTLPWSEERAASAIASELAFSNQALEFVLAELTARLVSFRDIRPQHVGAAARIVYLEHKHP